MEKRAYKTLTYEEKLSKQFKKMRRKKLSYKDEAHGDMFLRPSMDCKQRNEIAELKRTVSDLMVERESLLHEVTLFKTLNQDSQKKAAFLKEEVDDLKKKLEIQLNASPRSSPDMKKYMNEVSSQICKFKVALEEMQSKNVILAQKLVTFGSQIIKVEAVQGEGIRKMKKAFEDKIKMLSCEHRSVVADIIKKHALKTKSYEATVNQLREEIIRKESEKKMCQVMMKDLKCRMEKEVNQVRAEMEANAQKSEAQLKERLLEMEKALARLNKHSARAMREYQNKLQSVRREKELQVHHLLADKVQSMTGQKSKQVEDIANSLEMKYRNMVVNLDELNRKQRQSDLKGSRRQEKEKEVLVLYSQDQNKTERKSNCP